MMTKTVFLFDAATGEYQGTYAAQASPLEPGVFIEPVASTGITPPVAGADQVAVFASGAWTLEPDYRGRTAYDQTSGAPQMIETIGALAANLALTPSPAVALSQAQAAQNALLTAAYQAAIAQPVSYTSAGGVTQTYQADAGSVSNLKDAELGCRKAGATPSGFYWVAADNTQVPFSYADLLGLAAAMIAPGIAAFQHLQAQKAAVRAALTVAAVQVITW